MFAGEPQPVEIHHRGIWYSGELIGWRHESDDRVAARVRCRVDGLRHSAWVDLSDLRLPDPKRPPHKEPFPAVVHRQDRDEADATRPHALFAAMGIRPAKPAHVVQPPAPRSSVPPAPSDAVARPEPVPAPRRTHHLTKVEAYLSVV